MISMTAAVTSLHSARLSVGEIRLWFGEARWSDILKKPREWLEGTVAVRKDMGVLNMDVDLRVGCRLELFGADLIDVSWIEDSIIDFQDAVGVHGVICRER